MVVLVYLRNVHSYCRPREEEGEKMELEVTAKWVPCCPHVAAGDYSEEMKRGKGGQMEFQRVEYIKRFTSKSTKRVSLVDFGSAWFVD